MAVKVGELLDQPRHVRIAAVDEAKRKKAAAEEERLAKLEKERELAALMAQLRGAAQRVYEANVPMWRLLAAGRLPSCSLSAGARTR